MGRFFTFLMVGLIFALVSFRIDRIELLPDFVGYAFIFFGSHGMLQYTVKFKMPRNLAAPLIFLSLLTYLLPLDAAALLTLLNAALAIVLVWFLLAAVMRFAEERDRPDLARNAVVFRRFYVGIAVASFLIQLAAYFQPVAARDFVAIMALATLVILVLILHLLFTVRQELAVDVGGASRAG